MMISLMDKYALNIKWIWLGTFILLGYVGLSQNREVRIGLMWDKEQIKEIDKYSILSDLDKIDYSVLESLEKNLKNIHFKIVHFDESKKLIEASKTGEIDLGMHYITLTERKLNDSVYFSYPYQASSLVFFGHNNKPSVGKSIFLAITSKTSLRVIGILFLFICIYGHLIWFLERKKAIQNKIPLSVHYIPGIFEAVWQAFNIIAKLNVDQKRLHTVGYMTKIFSAPMWLVIVLVISVMVSEINKQLKNEELINKEGLLSSPSDMKGNANLYVIKERNAEKVAREFQVKTLISCEENRDLFDRFQKDPNGFVLCKIERLLIAYNRGWINPNDILIHNPSIENQFIAMVVNKKFAYENDSLMNAINRQLVYSFNYGTAHKPKIENNRIKILSFLSRIP